MTGFSATTAAMAGFRFIKDNPLTIVVWAIAYVLMFLLVIGLFALVAGASLFPFLRDPGAFERNPMGLVTSPALWGGIALAAVLVVLLSGVVYGALLRAFLRPEEGGVGYFRLGADELRLTGAYLLISLLSSAVNYGGQFALTAAGQAIGGTGGALLSGLGSLVLLGVVIWGSIRLSLVLPATFDRRRIALVDGWKLTRGFFWDMLGAYILAGLVCVAVFIVVIIIMMIIFAAAVAGGVATDNAGAGLATGITVAALIVLAYPIMIACFLPLMGGPSAYIYRALSADPDKTAATFA